MSMKTNDVLGYAAGVKPLIGITAGEIKNFDKPWAPTIYGQGHSYTDAIVRAGGVPIIIPLSSDPSVAKEIYNRLDGILFAGGNDISPELYGAALAGGRDISSLRDGTELHLMQLALSDQQPVLGICRGMQLLNAIQGGTLYQDIATDLPGHQDHEQSDHTKDTAHIAHLLRIAEHSKLASILGPEPIHANSNHHQAIKQVAPVLQAVAWAEDDIIEAIEHTGDPFIFGIQSHPEALEATVEPRWRLLFSAFVEAAAAGKRPLTITTSEGRPSTKFLRRLIRSR